MANYSEPEYFVERRKAGHIVVKEPPKFDLDAYIANYKGRTRLDRLIVIGTSSSYLYLEALKAAVAEAKRGRDVGMYQAAVGYLQQVAPGDPDAIVDAAWVDRMSKQVKMETDRLEQELKGYKNNLIKESIRMGYDDLGQHYHRIGDLVNSSKAYQRMRDHCTTSSHIMIMSLRLTNVHIDQANWLAVQSNVQRLRASGQKYPDADKNSAKLSAAMGLAYLNSGSFREAAQTFIHTDPRMVQAKLDDPNDEEAYNEVITPNDIAVYGGLCALASMTRDELQRGVLDNSSFRNYLELEPHIRRAISFFVSSKYSACLAILESYKPDYLLDIHLQRHLNELYFQIRSKAIYQYFIPFSHVTLSALASAFNTDDSTIEVELTSMIKRGTLDARIDLVDRVLVANQVDARNKMHEDAIAMAKEYERTALMRIFRIGVLNAGLEVKGPKGHGGGMGGMTPMGVDGMGSHGGGYGVGEIMGQGRHGLRSGGRFG